MNDSPRSIKFCAIDFEGDVGNLGLIGMSWYADDDSGYTTDRDTMLEVLHHYANNKYTLVCHNAEYDISVGFWQLDLNVTIVFKNNSFNHGRWVNPHTKKVTQVWCSWKLSYGSSLKNLGESIGLPKYDTPQRLTGGDPDKFKWKCDVHDKWECETCYAVRDAQICYEYMRQFTSFMLTQNCKIKRTLGSNAITLWKQMYPTISIQLPSLAHDLFARESYYGGRVECFKLGTVTPLHTADVKSMYPSVMIATPMPTSKSMSFREHENISPDILVFEGCTECTVHVPDMHVPPLPYRHADRLHFPTGTFRGTWCNLELRHAQLYGVEILAIHRTLYSTVNEYPFDSYIDYLRRARDAYLETGDTRQVVCKILMNSLYGRLGLNPVQIEEHVTVLKSDGNMRDLRGSELDVIDGKIIVRTMAPRMQAQYKAILDAGLPIPETALRESELSRHANVLWASQITAAARVKLHSHLVAQGDALTYCDTDSVFSSRPIVGIGTGFGELVDYTLHSGGYIAAPKMYWIDELDGTRNAKAKGVQRKLAEQYIKGRIVESNQPIRPRQATIRGILPGTWLPTFKQRKYQLSKRHVLNPTYINYDGGYSETTPLIMSLDGESESDDFDIVW